MTSYRMDVTSPCSDSDVTEGGASKKQNHPECIMSQPTANGTLPHLNEGETVVRVTKSLASCVAVGLFDCIRVFYVITSWNILSLDQSNSRWCHGWFQHLEPHPVWVVEGQMTSSDRTALHFYFCSELRLSGFTSSQAVTQTHNQCLSRTSESAEMKIPNTHVTVSCLVTWNLLAGRSPEFTWNLEPAKRTGSSMAQIENTGCEKIQNLCVAPFGWLQHST